MGEQITELRSWQWYFFDYHLCRYRSRFAVGAGYLVHPCQTVRSAASAILIVSADRCGDVCGGVRGTRTAQDSGYYAKRQSATRFTVAKTSHLPL
jgi:hypothetical protein